MSVRHPMCLFRLAKTDFPLRLLPQVTEAGRRAGVTARCWHGIPLGTPVTAAMGDLQCYLLATLQSDTDAGPPCAHTVGSSHCFDARWAPLAVEWMRRKMEKNIWIYFRPIRPLTMID